MNVFAPTRWLIVLALVSVGWRSDAAMAQDAAPTAQPLGTISGVIVLEDGTSPKTKGSLSSTLMPPSETPNPDPNPNPSPKRSEFSSRGECKDTFSFQIKPGTVYLKYFCNGFAPIAVGPLEVAPGQTLKNVKLVLRAGRQALVRVESSEGKPVQRAKIIKMTIIAGDSHGSPIDKVDANEKGEYRLEHLIDVPYFFHVSAPGYEPLTIERLSLDPDEPNILTMTASLPATGTVFNADGKPAAGAKIRLQYDQNQKNDTRPRIDFHHFAEVLATADNDGRFKLDQLARDSNYLFVVEGTDHSRIVVRNLQAGVEGVQIRLPKDQNLRVRLVGDLGSLTKRKGRPYVWIQQWIQFDPKSSHAIGLADNGGFVTPTEEGGVVDYPGLVLGKVEVTNGTRQTTASVIENGLTEVTIQLEPKKDKTPQK